MSEIRITHIVFDFDGGGLESIVAEMARQYRGTSIKVSVVSLSGREGRLGHEIGNIAEYRVLKPLRAVSLAYPRALASELRSLKPDVVHVHNGSWWKGALAARMAGVKRVVYTEHGREHSDSSLSRALDRRAASITNRVVAVSDRLARYLVRVVEIRPTLVATIPNGVDTQRFRPGAASAVRKQLGIPDGTVVVGSLGRFEPVKAYHRLILAIAAVKRRTPGLAAACVLWGDGAERMKLEAIASELGISDSVRFPGWTRNPVDAHRSLDVFALTSLSEGASMSLLESMACGAVPVVTDVGANAEILGPALAGQIVPSGDDLALAATLESTFSSVSLSSRLSTYGRTRVEAEFSLSRMLERYERVYRE